MTRLFYAYATADARSREQLEKQLNAVKQRSAGNDNALAGWESREVTRTGDWRRAVSPHVGKADVVLFLMSADMIASGYLDGPDVAAALERQRNGEAKLFTVLLRPCNMSSTAVAALPVLPRDGKPVTRWNSADAAFQAIGAGIAGAIGLAGAAPPSVPAAPPPSFSRGLAHGAAPSATVSAAPATNGRASLSDIALPPEELGPEYASVDQPKERDDASTESPTKFVTVARAGARRVAQLVFRASGHEAALSQLSTAVHAELAEGAKAEPVDAPPEGMGDVTIRRVAATGGSVNVSTFATKGRYLVAAKVMGGPAGATAIGSVDPATLSERVVHRMLTRIPE